MEVKEEILITVPSEETYIPEKEFEPKVHIMNPNGMFRMIL